MDDEKKSNKMRLSRHLLVSQETYDIIMKDCVNEYRESHPELDGAKISQNHILRQMARFYLK